MKLVILAVGRMKAGPERELFDRFAERTRKSGKPLHLDGPELFEISEGRSRDPKTRKQDEARQLLQSVDKSARIILLDERGRDLDSVGFAKLIAGERDEGTGRLCFALGGADGHGDTLKDAAVTSIRFGAMTWPHQIARIMLAEQLYRATTILGGHPYHRE